MNQHLNDDDLRGVAITIGDLFDLNAIIREHTHLSGSTIKFQESLLRWAVPLRVNLGADSFTSVGEASARLVEKVAAMRGAPRPEDEATAPEIEVVEFDEATPETELLPDPEPIPEGKPRGAVDPKLAEDAEKKTGPLSYEEQEEIARLSTQGVPNGEIAKRLNRWIGPINGFVKKLPELRAQEQVKKTLAAAPNPEPVKAEPKPSVTPPRPAPAQEPVKKPVDVPPAPCPTLSPVPADAPIWKRHIAAHLNALGNKGEWTPQLDALIVKKILSGTNWEILVDEVGLEKPLIVERYRALMNGSTDSQHQRQVHEVLQERAEK